MNWIWLAQRVQRLPKQSRHVALICASGLAAGGITVVFQLGINWLFKFGLVRISRLSSMEFLIYSFLIVVGSSLIVGWLLNSFCRSAAGSGIPQYKLSFWKDFSVVPIRVIWVKFIAGILSVGGGSSLGREGPSVQLGGGVASNISELAGDAKQTRRAAGAAGAAAGLAAAFNTPLAATTFVLEEIIGDLNSRYLGGVLLASVLGAFVVHAIIGRQPSFTLIGAASPSWIGYAMTPVVAALASLVGVYFQRFTLNLRARVKINNHIPAWLFPGIGGLLTWGLGAFVFCRTGHLGVFGLGYQDLSSALAGDIGWQLACILLVTKFVVTFSCYGLGGCGGIFSPTLFFGGMVGIVTAGLLNLEFPVSHTDTLALAVVGMSACLGSVVFAPVTGIIMVFEMTHEFALVPALMIGALVSQTISRKMNHINFYDALLVQDGHRMEHLRPPRDLEDWQHLPVSAIANFSPVTLDDLTPALIECTLKAHPYGQFPVVKDNQILGILSRQEAKLALTQKRPPSLTKALTCQRDQNVGQLEKLLIESDSRVVLVLDRKDGKLIGLVTLHDLLRAESSMTEKSKEKDAIDFS